MSSITPTIRTPPEAGAGETTTLVRPDEPPPGADSPDLHPQLRTQLKELRTSSPSPDLAKLLRVVSAHYEAIDEERRGIVQSMRLMADEARALAREAREQSSEHLQVILDHIKDVVLTVDEDGAIQSFNPTGERVFGYAEAELVGQRIDLLIPKIAVQESVPEALQRLAAASGDTAVDLAPRRSRDAAPTDPTPPLQPDGTPSPQRARAYILQTLDGHPQVFEWLHRDASGKEIICEVRLVRLPSGSRRLVRGSIADISERK